MNNTEFYELTKRLSLADGTSGDEKRVRELIKSRLPSDCEVREDNLGNLIVFKKGAKTPKNKLMLCAHMDEVGFIVTYITDEGYLRFSAVGGIIPAVVFGRKVAFPNGTTGVIAAKATHQVSKEDDDKQPQLDDLLIDIGAADKADAEKYVSLGDCCVFVSEYFEFGNGFLKGKALDDRIGCAVMTEMLNSESEYDMYFVFTVQEEIGARGAAAAAYGIKPDYAVVLETTTACDIAGVEGEKRVCRCGMGCVCSYMDKGTMYDKELYSLAFDIAEKNGIKLQTKTVVAGGNDSKAIHISAGGIRTVALSVPCRYLHSPSCVVKKEDCDSLRKMASAMAKELCGL